MCRPPPQQSPPTVKQALVHAASTLSTVSKKKGQVLRIEMTPLVLHLLAGLQRAGVERAVVAVGEDAEAMEAAVEEQKFDLQIDYVYVLPSMWRNLANSILISRAAFKQAARAN